MKWIDAIGPPLIADVVRVVTSTVFAGPNALGRDEANTSELSTSPLTCSSATSRRDPLAFRGSDQRAENTLTSRLRFTGIDPELTWSIDATASYNSDLVALECAQTEQPKPAGVK